jgi:ketosteroid isomerase-like protein
MPPGVPRRLGKAEIRREMRPLFDPDGRRRIAIQPEEVRILGARAYAHGTYELEFEGGGEIRRCSGKFLNILEKQVDGSWKITVDCHNYSEFLE